MKAMTFCKGAAMIAVLCIVAPTFGTANWASLTYSLPIPSHISTVGQSFNGSVVMTLMHDTPCSVAITPAGAGQEVLTNGGDSLQTEYKFTGPTLAAPDATWVSSGTFITHTYNVLGTGPVDAITLSVQGTAAPDRAPNAGDYTAGLVFTVSW